MATNSYILPNLFTLRMWILRAIITRSTIGTYIIKASLVVISIAFFILVWSLIILNRRCFHLVKTWKQSIFTWVPSIFSPIVRLISICALHSHCTSWTFLYVHPSRLEVRCLFRPSILAQCSHFTILIIYLVTRILSTTTLQTSTISAILHLNIF